MKVESVSNPIPREYEAFRSILRQVVKPEPKDIVGRRLTYAELTGKGVASAAF